MAAELFDWTFENFLSGVLDLVPWFWYAISLFIFTMFFTNYMREGSVKALKKSSIISFFITLSFVAGGLVPFAVPLTFLSIYALIIFAKV